MSPMFHVKNILLSLRLLKRSSNKGFSSFKNQIDNFTVTQTQDYQGDQLVIPRGIVPNQVAY